MLKVMTVKEASDYVEYSLSIQGQPFAPVVSNPMDLRYKQDKIKNFADKNK